MRLLGRAGVSAAHKEPHESHTEGRAGERAIKLLDKPRRELLQRLQKDSDAPVDLVVDERTRAILSISLHVPTQGDSLYQRAIGFLDIYQTLIDPFIASSDYVLADTDPACYDGTAVLDRVIKGVPVVGSRLTLHFDDTHALAAITNGVTSTPPDIVDVDVKAIDGARPLKALMPAGFEGEPTRTPVFVPAPDLKGVFAAEMVQWAEPAADGSVPVAAVAVGDTAISGPLVVTTPTTTAPKTPTEPQYLDRDGLPLPEFITYRGLGGVHVNHFPWEQNPTEMAYRFLEEHPALAHTFAARCQFAPTALDEDAAAPGVYFVRLSQKYGALPVFGSELVIMQEGLGNVVSVAGRTLPKIEAASTPTIAIGDALTASQQVLEDGAQQRARLAVHRRRDRRRAVWPGVAAQRGQPAHAARRQHRHVARRGVGVLRQPRLVGPERPRQQLRGEYQRQSDVHAVSELVLRRDPDQSGVLLPGRRVQ